MKIAVFHGLPFGGAKRVLYEEIKALSKNHDIYLYQISGENDRIFNLEKYAMEVHKYNFNTKNNFPSFLNRFYSDYKKLFALREIHKNIAKEIDASNFDVVLIHPDFYTQAPFILRYLKTRKIYYCHELLRIAYEKEFQLDKSVALFKRWYEGMIRQLMKRIDRNNARFADVILTNSTFTKQNIKMAYQKNSIVCYPGVDTDFFKPIRGISKKTVLFAGDESLILESGFEKKLSEILDGKCEIIRFIRSKNNIDENLKKLYNEALVTVCLTQNEPFGMVPLESMSCGVPVIALNSGGYKETILDNKTGFLIEQGTEELKSKLAYFISKTDKLAQMGNAARKHVELKFTWKKHIEVLEGVLK